MRSQTEYFHRFIRFKNIDPERQVLLENAVERYLVELEREQDVSKPFASKSSYTETVIYNTLQEDTTVPSHIPGKKSYTLLMIVERKQQHRNMNLATSFNRVNTFAERGGFDMNSQSSLPFTDIGSEIPLEPGQLKTVLYSELNQSFRRLRLAKWARKFQNFIQGIYFFDLEEQHSANEASNQQVLSER